MATAVLRPKFDDRPSVLSGERGAEPSLASTRPRGTPVNALQFARSISDAERRERARQMRDTVTAVKPEEFSRVIQLLGKLKARYAAMVLELGRSERVSSSSIVVEIKNTREQIFELEQGLAFLRQAVIDGEVRVAGVTPPAD
jgi:hypothetical protein